MPDLPARLLRQGRPVDPVFSPDERLYRAVPRKDLTADGRLLPPAIEFPDFSLNRERSGKAPPKKLRTLFRLMLFPKVVIVKEPEPQPLPE